ncbi:MAG: YceI family protein [Proteobacteria bacterium]|nr:YceI family protein [Pseudomonadota bacterium]
MVRFLISIFFTLFVMSSYASSWTIDLEQSKLNFISIKKVHVAEVHRFNQFQGELDEQGQFNLAIDLTSVDTNIEVRDNRLREFLFDTEKYATATLTASIDSTELDKLAVAQSKSLSLDAILKLHGQEKVMQLKLLITKISDNELLVISSQPVLLNVSDFALVAGVEKLRELAKLPSISYVVPVTFQLLLTRGF